MQAVRLRQMTYNQVRQIDDHPLVSAAGCNSCIGMLQPTIVTKKGALQYYLDMTLLPTGIRAGLLSNIERE